MRPDAAVGEQFIERAADPARARHEQRIEQSGAAGRLPEQQQDARRRRAGASRRSGGRAVIRAASARRSIDLAGEIVPEPFVERRERRMHARLDRIARPRDRHLVLLGDARARPLREQIDAVGQADRLFEIVGDEQHADALPLDQRGDVLDDAGAHDRVERGERLVHQQELRLHRQHLRERDALALAAAEMARDSGRRSRRGRAARARYRPAPAPLLRAMPLKVRPSATLSRAVFHGSSASSWNSMPISEGATPASTVPASGFCSPITARSRLDLPEPEGPTRLTNWPSPTSRLAPSRTGSPP